MSGGLVGSGGLEGKRLAGLRAQNIIRRLDRRIALILVSLLMTLWIQFPRFMDEYAVDGDFRTFYWMNKFRDAELFPDDPFRGSGYVNIRLLGTTVPLYLSSPGYGLLFYAASFLVTPAFFSKILGFVLLPLTVWCLYEFGQAARDRSTALALALGFMLLSLASPSSTSIVTGLQRSFGFSLVVFLVYCLYRRKYVGATVTVLSSALIFAPMFALNVAIWGVSVLGKIWRPAGERSRRGMGALWIAILLGVLVISPAFLSRFSHIFTGHESEGFRGWALGETGDLAHRSYDHLWDDPYYRPGGREPLFYLFPFVGDGGIVNNGEDGVHLLVLLGIGCLIVLVRGRRAFDLPYEVWCVLWASLVMFALSWVAIALTDTIPLYLPSRYTRVGLLIYLLVFVVWNGKEAAQEAADLIHRRPKTLFWLIGGVSFLVLGLVLLYPSDRAKVHGFNMKWLLLPMGLVFGVLAALALRKPAPTMPELSKLMQTRAARVFSVAAIVACLVGWAVYAPIVSNVDVLDPPPAERELLSFLATLPKDVLLAGTPYVLDNVPLFARRQVLLNLDLGGLDVGPTYEALSAYYTDDEQVLIDFCHAYGIDYLVFDLQAYSEEYLATRMYYEPYRRALLSRLAGQERFVLAQVPDNSKVFQAEDLVIVPCDESLGGLQGIPE